MNNQAQIERRSNKTSIARALLTDSFLTLLILINFGIAVADSGKLQFSFSEQSAVLNMQGSSSGAGKMDQGAAASPLRSVSSSPLDDWQWRSPLPQQNNYNTLAYGNNTFVAIGGLVDPALATSFDGIVWNRGSLPFSGILSVAFGGNLFVAIGGDGIYTSSDGREWKKRLSFGLGESMHALVGYVNNIFIIPGEKTYISSDGIHWTKRAGPAVRVWYDGIESAIAYGNGVYVLAMGDNGTYSSTDAVNWTSQPSRRFDTVAYGNGVFVASSSRFSPSVLYTSGDGANWTEVKGARGASSLLFADGLFRGAASGGTVTSPDGLNWTVHSPGSGPGFFGVIMTYGSGIYVGVEGYRIYSSTDGATWTERSTSVRANIMAYGNGTYVGIAGQTSVTSSDGIKWTEQAAGVSFDGINAIAYGNGMYAAVGDGGYIITSPDGVTWTGRSSGTSNKLHRITYARDMFVAVGDAGIVVTSPDGETWTATAVSVPSGSWFAGIAYSGEKFVAVGYNTVATSPDGVTWTGYTTKPLVNFTALTFGNNVFAAFAYTGDGPNAGCMATSVDGMKWKLRPAPSRSYVEDMTFGSGAFAAVGRYEDGTALILTSRDGASWKRQALPKPMNGDFSSVTFGKGTFVAAGAFVGIDQHPGAAGIVQSGNLCTYSISPGTEAFGSKGGSASVTIKTSDADCRTPAISASADWITYGDPAFSGSDGTLQVNVAANPTSSSRTGRLTIGVASVSITQAGQICTIGPLTPPSATYDKSGGTGELALAVTPADCLWTAKRQGAAWVKITAGASGSGDGTISYTVKPNAGKKDRSGAIKVTLRKGGASQISTINQAGQ